MKWHYEVLKKFIIARDGNICRVCGEPTTFENASIDHIVATTNGGRNEMSNLQVAHRLCNISKGRKTMNGLIERVKPSNGRYSQHNLDLKTQEEYDRLDRYAKVKGRTKSDVLREFVRSLPEFTDEELAKRENEAKSRKIDALGVE